MDTTPEYVKMCEKAVEVQDLHDVAEGDVAASIYENGYVHATIANELDIGWTGVSGTWLPRQDQMQEMIDERDLSNLLSYAYWFSISQQDKFHSMEQLYLGLVMKNKFGKFWNGEDWAKEE